MKVVSQNYLDDIKKILLNDDIALVGIAGELNRFKLFTRIELSRY